MCSFLVPSGWVQPACAHSLCPRKHVGRWGLPREPPIWGPPFQVCQPPSYLCLLQTAQCPHLTLSGHTTYLPGSMAELSGLTFLPPSSSKWKDQQYLTLERQRHSTSSCLMNLPIWRTDTVTLLLYTGNWLGEGQKPLSCEVGPLQPALCLTSRGCIPGPSVLSLSPVCPFKTSSW